MVKTAGEHPTDVVFHNIVPSKTLRQSLMRFGDAVLDKGFSAGDPYRAAVELILRRPPPLSEDSTSLQRPGEKTVDAAGRIARALDGSVLAIQGPPGTGKTYTGARVICALVRAGLMRARARGTESRGVTAVSHKVILNLLHGR